jgi:C-terminal processing protease CtpA/Prc
LPRSVIFALFTAEEEGLIGSDYFIKHPPVPLEQIIAMLNLDMVGRMKDDTLLMGGWGTAPIWESMMKDASIAAGVKTQSFEKGGLGPSDHMSFALKKIPVLFLFTGLHKDYHRPTDTADKINYAGIDRAVDLSQRLVTAMAGMPRQQYDASSDSKATMAFATGHGKGGVGGMRAALGVVPDYSSMDAKDGVHITGVGGGSPAEAAGLQPGDVLTQWNDRALNNLQDLSDDLAQANPGDRVEITVLRDGKPVKVQARLGTRKN